MAGLSDYLWIVATAGGILLFMYLYVASIRKVLLVLGFKESEASAILFGTLFLGWITVPVFPYGGWWVGLSIGGAVIPIVICLNFFLKGRVLPSEAFIGITIVAYVTYTVTRAEEGVGIVADLPLALAPALAAGLYALSVFWTEMSKAAPLAYVSGVLGTLIGADVFRLGEILSFDAPEGEFAMLSIGGANVFDMVYLTGIVAVGLSMFLLWAKMKRDKLGYGAFITDFESNRLGQPYAKEPESLRPLSVRKGKLQ